MPLASQLGSEESSLEISSSSTPARAPALSVRPEFNRQSDCSSSGPIRRNRARSLSYGPASRSLSLQPAPTFAANVGPSHGQSPTGPSMSHQELHLHQHAHRQANLSGLPVVGLNLDEAKKRSVKGSKQTLQFGPYQILESILRKSSRSKAPAPTQDAPIVAKPSQCHGQGPRENPSCKQSLATDRSNPTSDSQW